MCVSIILSLFPKVAGNVPKHDRLHNGYSLQIKETTNINVIPSETIIWKNYRKKEPVLVI